MTNVRRVPYALLFVAILAGCSGRGLTPNGNAENAGAPALRASGKYYGIGLSGNIAASVPNGLTATTYERTFCQTGKKIGCPPFSLGQRTYHVSLTKTLAWSGGSFTPTAIADSALGKFEYDTDLATNSASSHVFQSVSTTEMFEWIDQLKITSGSMPYGTKASFKATLTLVPTRVDVKCSAYDFETLTFNFSSNGLPGGYSRLDGQCVKGKFAFFINGPSHAGKTIVETIKGSVGQSLNIQGVGSVTTSLCKTTGCMPLHSILKGAVVYKIESMTSGVGFTTASGAKY